MITYDKEYEGNVVDVPQLPCCMSQGQTIDEATENVKDAIRRWLNIEEMLCMTYTQDDSPVYLSEVYV